LQDHSLCEHLDRLASDPAYALVPLLVARAGIYPLQNTCIRKVKVLKAPKFDITKLMEVHGDYSEEVGAKIERPVVTEVVGAAE
jgi:hypothetical protein